MKFNNAKVIAINKNPTAKRFLESYTVKMIKIPLTDIVDVRKYMTIGNNAINNWWNVFYDML